MLISHGNFTSLNYNNIGIVICRLFIGAILVSIVCASKAHGYAVVYSDMYFSQEGIIGLGITQDDQNGANHTYWIEAQLTSANGRVASSTSYRASGWSVYLRHEVPMTLDDLTDIGNYTLTTTHMTYCPYGGNFVGGILDLLKGVGYSKSCYYLWDGPLSPPAAPAGFPWEYHIWSDLCQSRAYCSDTYIYSNYAYPNIVAHFWFFHPPDAPQAICEPYTPGIVELRYCDDSDCKNVYIFGQ